MPSVEPFDDPILESGTLVRAMTIAGEDEPPIVVVGEYRTQIVPGLAYRQHVAGQRIVDPRTIESLASVVLLDWVFDHVGEIAPDRSPDGAPLEFLPQDRYRDAGTAVLHAHGAGPFCRFRVPGASRRGGVYAVTLDADLVYVGKAQDISQRWGLSGYGSIQPRNCYVGGQSTNCKINSRVLEAVRRGSRVDLYFLDVADRHTIETTLISTLRPPWNGRQ